MSVLDHLRELRRRLVVMVLIVAAGSIVGWVFYQDILNFLKEPYCSIPAKYRYVPGGTHECVLTYHGVLDGFTARLKVSVIAGAVLTGPLWLYQIWAFIVPGLRKNERKYTIVFVIASTVLFVAGMALAYAVLSKGLRVLVTQATSSTQAILTVTDYLNFVTLLLVVFGAAFELPLLVVMANFAGVLPAKLLRKSQRLSIFLIFVFAAVATPSTDPFTMCAMAIPMCLLFEAAVVIAVVHDRRKAQRRAVAVAPDPGDDVPSRIDPIPQPLDDQWTDTT
ncbi:MAG: twin-arginine translocase subunit TatC [Actinobacteria bacterium]|nr:twin-arginine translocase subunit TatC [Actinomycetota bacterium]